ncbi:MAG: CpaD family pilus assembly protein [Bosea sp. (in: a-proteobacteria)]
MIAATPNRKPASKLSIARTVLVAGVIAAGLAACEKKELTLQTYPTDVRERHPIVLRDGVKTLDVFATRGGLDDRQLGDVHAFAADYQRSGRGAIVAEVPSGPGRDHAAQAGLASVRNALSKGGVSAGALRVGSYQAHDPTMAAPIRLSFAGLKAEVPHECGQWPHDLGSSQFRNGLENRAYWNFGCAYQSNLAAQVADPVDLVRGRPEGRIDTAKRMYSIDQLRKGKDPSTEYRQEATKINQAVGTN